MNVLDELDSGLEEGNREFATAEAPKAEDTLAQPNDYVIGPDDLLQVTVYDLEGVGLQTIKNARVSGTGNVTLPFLNSVVHAEGLTELELQQSIADAYKQAGVLEQANVSVAVGEARNRAFTMLGAVQHSGQYLITQDDFRVLDAITQAGDINNPMIEHIYILRRTDLVHRGAGTPAGAAPGATTQPAKKGSTQPIDDLAPPQSKSNVLPKKLKKSVMLQDQGAAAPSQVGTEVRVSDDDPSARVGRIDGQEVVVQPTTESPMPATTMGSEDMSGKTFEFNELPATTNIRIIRVPIAKIRNGDLRYNIVIKPRDTIYVPPGMIGFYYMNGHISATGAYAFQGQKVSLKNAIAAARGMDGLSIPQRTDIIRKIGPNQQMYYRVDLAKIFAGEAPDIYLKPDDQVIVGTNILAPFLAAIRGGFRMTYGFGFLYDRNYAYSSNDQGR